jgi:mttA/Hcf106 family
LKAYFNPCTYSLLPESRCSVFGPKKLPELGKGMGEGIRGFKAAMQGKEELPALNVALPKVPEEKA